MATKATTGKSGLELARKGAMQARVQALRQAAEGYIEHVADEIAPYDELDESFDDDGRRKWVSEVQEVRDALHEQLADARKLAEELEDAAEAQSDIEDLQTDIESAMDDIDTHLAAIGAKSDRPARHKSGGARERLQDALEEVQGLQREDRPDVDMLTDLRNEVEGIGRRETDENLVEAADRLLEAIDELIARAETVGGMRDDAANDDKSAPRGGAHKLYA